MEIELRDASRRRVGRIELAPDSRPTRVSAVAGDGSTREVFLNWDRARDDAGRLRRCVACGCPDLFQRKSFPQVTGFVIVLAFAGAIAGVFGLATRPPVLTAMITVLVADVAILLFSKRRLVCYRCRTTYRRLAIARYHRSWDRTVAERHPAPETTPAEPVPASDQEHRVA